jgi:signal transduction histidine kinase
MTMPPPDATNTLDSLLDTWTRRKEPALAVLPYGLLLISVILTVMAESGDAKAVIFDLALAGLAVVWMLWMVTLHPAWTERSILMAVYFIGLIVLMAALVLRAPWFGFFAFAGYIHAFRFLRGIWRLVGVAAVAVIAATSQYGGLPQFDSTAVATYTIFVLIDVLVAGAGTWFVWVSAQQSERRKQAVASLVEANRRLGESLQENTRLHVQLLTRAREAGIFDERQRMAREIHDTLAQGFTAIIAQLEAAESSNQHAADWQAHVEQAKRMARESLTEARRSVQALRPEPLEHAQLPEALAALAERWSQAAGVALTFETTGEARPLLADIEVALFRVTQEALANVARHARASRVGVTLSYLDDVVLLDVRDDGVGFTLEPGRSTDGVYEGQGFGLSTMRQRVWQVAGTLEIESARGEGTAVSASVPALPAGGQSWESEKNQSGC